MERWKRIDPTKVHNAGYRTLVDKTFLLPNGKTYTATTFNAEGEQSVAVLALTPDNQVIVARQFRPGPERIMDEIPGGWVEPGEGKEVAAARELLEETGYRAEKIAFLGTAHYDAYSNDLRHCFLATGCELVEGGLKHDEEEVIDVRLVTIDEIIKIAKHGNMTDPSAVFMAHETLQSLKEQT